MNNIGAWLMGLIAALLLLSLSAFTVDEREYALVFRLGEIISVKKEPGLISRCRWSITCVITTGVS